MKAEHIGIAVRSLAAASEVYSLILNTSPYKQEAVDSEGVNTLFFRAGDTKIELLEATREDSPIARFIEKRGEGMHHIAFEVADIRAEMERLRTAGVRLLNETPKRGADNKWVCFLHPASCGGVLVELCQEITE
ncbi:MAG: methylmalonyl-CoA epimerase [Bacteroidia bacterium]|nr:methylmalonyl-CoA epimerase [Bacteroidia bacterium]